MNNLTIYFEQKKIAFQKKLADKNTHNQKLTVLSNDISKNNIKLTIEWFLRQKDCTQLIFLTDDLLTAENNLIKAHKCIDAAGGFITCEEGALFIFRNNKWDLPKGKLDKGETIADAAIRECEEECGISNLKIKKQLPETFHFYHLKGTLILKRTFWFEMRTIANQNLIPQTEEGITKIKWFTKSNLKQVLKNTFPNIIDVVHNVKWNSNK